MKCDLTYTGANKVPSVYVANLTDMAVLSTGTNFRATAMVKLGTNLDVGEIRAKIYARCVDASGTHLGDLACQTQSLTDNQWVRLDGYVSTSSITAAYPTATRAQTKIVFTNDVGDGAAGSVTITVDEISGQMGDPSWPTVPAEYAGGFDEYVNQIRDPQVAGTVGGSPSSYWSAYQPGGGITRTIVSATVPGLAVTRAARFTGTATSTEVLITPYVGDPASGTISPSNLLTSGYRIVTGGGSYTVSYWVKADYAQTGAYIRAYFRDGSGTFVVSLTSGATTVTVGQWTLVTATFNSLSERAVWAMSWVVFGHASGVSIDASVAAPIDAPTTTTPPYFDSTYSNARALTIGAAVPSVARSLIQSRRMPERPTRTAYSESFESTAAGTIPSSRAGTGTTVVVQTGSSNREMQTLLNSTGINQHTEGWILPVQPVVPGQNYYFLGTTRVLKSLTSPYGVAIAEIRFRKVGGITTGTQLYSSITSSNQTGTFDFAINCGIAPSDAIDLVVRPYVQQAGNAFPYPAGTVEAYWDNLWVGPANESFVRNLIQSRLTSESASASETVSRQSSRTRTYFESAYADTDTINLVTNPSPVSTTGYSVSGGTIMTAGADASSPTGYSIECRPPTTGSGTDSFINATTYNWRPYFGSGDYIDVGAYVWCNADAFAQLGQSSRNGAIAMFSKGGTQGYTETRSARNTSANTWEFVTLRAQAALTATGTLSDEFLVRLYNMHLTAAGAGDPRVRWAGVTIRKVNATDPAMTANDLVYPGKGLHSFYGSTNASRSSQSKTYLLKNRVRTMVESALASDAAQRAAHAFRSIASDAPAIDVPSPISALVTWVKNIRSSEFTEIYKSATGATVYRGRSGMVPLSEIAQYADRYQFVSGGIQSKVLHNLAPNPGAEVDTSNWIATQGTIARTTSNQKSGAGGFQITSSGAGGSCGIHHSGVMTPVTAGKMYWGAAQFRSDLADGRYPVIFLDFYDSGNNRISAPGASGTALTTGGWTRVTMVAQAPIGAVKANIICQVQLPAAVAGKTTYIDEIIWDEGDTVRDFESGSTSGWIWDGTPQASTSKAYLYTWTANVRSGDMTNNIWVDGVQRWIGSSFPLTPAQVAEFSQYRILEKGAYPTAPGSNTIFA